MIALYIGIGVLILLLGITLVRTFRFKPIVSQTPPVDLVSIDEKHIIESMKQMLKFRTISNIDSSLVDEKPFADFREYLITRYPAINAKATRVLLPDTAVMYKIKGTKKNSSEAFVFMSHYDVVPENGTWKHDPFLGEVINGKIYGRGALDTKQTLCAVMESVEQLLQSGFEFIHDTYLAFSGDEEILGISAKSVVNYFKEHNITPTFVLDEGGAVVSDVFPGVKQKAALIGTAEKGFIAMSLTAKASGGHASMPPKTTPVTRLAKAITALNEGNIHKVQLTEATKKMFDNVARTSKSFMIRLIFANLWLFFPLVKLLATKSEGALLSLLKTTQAFTMMQGSEAINILPSEATIGINYRIITGDTVDSVVSRVSKVVEQYGVEVNAVRATEATSVSKLDEKYEAITEAIHKTWEGVITTPYLMMATTDSRHYHEISDHVYRFSAVEMSNTDRGTIHGVDEAIPVEQMLQAVRFYLHLITKLHAIKE